MTFEQLKKNYIQELVASHAILIKFIDEDPFTLRGGRTSCMFLDHSRVATSPKAYRAFINVISALLREDYGEKEIILCNVDSKISAQMVGSLAYNLHYPQIVFKSDALTAVEKGTANQMTGDAAWDLPVAIIDDVMTEGDGTAKKVGDLVKETFPLVKDIRIFVGFTREVKESTYPSHHVLTRDELLREVWKTLNSGQQKAIEKELGHGF